MAKLTKTEAAFISQFLEELSDKFGNDGCNDLTVKDSPENLKLVQAAERALDDGIEDDELPVAEDGWIATGNVSILDYLRERFDSEYGLINAPPQFKS